MAYYSGSVNDMAALRTALVDACVSEGWSWDAGTDVLSKGASFLRLQVVSGYLTLLGRTSASGGNAPDVVRIGQLQSVPLTWPATYEIFAFATEVYLVLKYSVDYYQWCAFGLSSISLPGTGMFVAASIGPVAATNGIEISAAAGDTYSSQRVCPALFWSGGYYAPGSSGSWQAGKNQHLHSNLDGHGWSLGDVSDTSTTSTLRHGISTLAPLVGLLPNTWNSEAVLLPIRCWKMRPSFRISIIADLQHARYTRLDNYDPGQVIELGADRWKVFPWYRKNIAARNGGVAIAHTGTFGWAIRYEGP